jgi:NADH-quinone oxidoreductase subunit L
MLIATLAISAVPPFAGYFSKDLVLEGAYVSGHVWLWMLGVITAGITSFYMFRLIFMTFFGDSRVAPEKVHHLHESPPVMTIPLIVLAVFSIVGGWVGLPDWLLWGDAFKRFLAPVFKFAVLTPGKAIAVGGAEAVPQSITIIIGLIALGAGLLGIILAWICYIQKPGLPNRIAASLRGLYDLLWHKYYIDEIYHRLVTLPLFWISTVVLSQTVDRGIIDGMVNGTGLTVEGSGEGVRRAETGNLQHYAFVYLIGVIGIAAYYVYLVIS